jgi:hypothetical protein
MFQSLVVSAKIYKQFSLEKNLLQVGPDQDLDPKLSEKPDP